MKPERPMRLDDMIAGLIKSADNCGCSDGLTVIEEKWIDMIKEFFKNNHVIITSRSKYPQF